MELPDFLNEWWRIKDRITIPFIVLCQGNENWGCLSTVFPNRTRSWGMCTYSICSSICVVYSVYHSVYRTVYTYMHTYLYICCIYLIVQIWCVYDMHNLYILCTLIYR